MSARRVPVNAAALFAGRVFGALVSLVVVSLAAHRLDLDQFGLMASIMAAGFLANSLVTFGTDTVVTRAIAADPDAAAHTTMTALKLQSAAALIFVTAALIAFFVGVDVAVLVQALALVPMAWVTVTGAALRGIQRMDQLFLANVGGGVAALLALVFGFSRYEATWVPIAALAVGSATTATLSFRYAQPALQPVSGAASASTGSIGSLAREAAPFAAMVVLAAVGAQAGLLLVEFAGEETAGGYGVAIRVNEAARMIPAAAMGAFFPAMLSGLHRTDRYRRWLRWLMMYGVAATGVLLVFAEPMNRIVFDNQPDGAPLVRILSLGLIFTVIRLALSFELIAGGYEGTVLGSALVGALVTVFGGLMVVSRFGAQGVAWAQFVGLVFATALLLIARAKSPDPAAASAV